MPHQHVSWTEALSVGNELLDTQHRSLLDLINQLIDAFRAGQEKTKLEEAIKTMAHYAQVHFTEEERLMAMAAYPYLKGHRKKHREFIEQLLAFDRDFAPESAEYRNQVLGFLKTWYVQHIHSMDRQYRPYIAKIMCREEEHGPGP